MIRLRRSSKSVVTTWLITYIVTLLFPFFISLFLYMFSSSIIEQQCVDTNQLISSNMALEMEQIFLNNKSVKESLGACQAIPRLAVQDGESMLYYNDDISTDIGQVKQILSSYSIVDTTAVVMLNRSEAIVSVEGVFGLEEFLSTLEGMNNPRTMNQLKYETTETYSVVSSDDTSQYLLYSAPLLSGASILDDAKLLVWCKVSSIVEKIEQLRGKVLLEYAILDHQNNLIVSSNKFGSENVGIIQSEYYRKGFFEMDGMKYYLDIIRSKNFDFQYLLAISYVELFGQLRTYRILMMVSAVFCILFGSFMIYLFVKNNYKSVNSILSKIKYISGVRPSKGENEYATIRQALETLEKKNDIAMNMLDESTSRLTHEIISKMLMSLYVGRDEFDQIVKGLPFRYDGRCFAVMVAEIWDDSAFYADEAISSEEKKHTNMFILNNVFSELLEPYQCYFIELNGQLVTILNANVIDGKLNEILEKGQQFITKNFELKFSIALSDVQEDLYTIGRKYRQCLALLETGKTFEKNAVLTPEIAPPITGIYSYSADKEEKLMNHLKNKRYESSMKLIDSVFEESFSSSLAIMPGNNYVLYNIMGTIIRYISALSIEEDNEIILNMVLDVFDANVAGTARDALDALIGYLCSMEISASKDSDFLTRKSIKIVEREYANPSLSVTYIADQLGFHPVYVSSRFKGKSGEGLLEYISKYRIAKAKEIMSAKDGINIEDVSVMVGYTNAKTFSRVFRKYEGMIPSKWRNSARTDENEL